MRPSAMQILDLTGKEEGFLRLLKAETVGEAMVVRSAKGELELARPLPDCALILDRDRMMRLPGRARRVSHTIDMDHVRTLQESGEPLSIANLVRGEIASVEGLVAFGMAFVTGEEFWESEILRRIPDSRPGLRVVAYCPEAIRSAAAQLHAQVKWIPAKRALSALERFVIHHELGHLFIDPNLVLDDSRMHDAFASHLAHGALKDDFARVTVEAFSVLFQGTRYNYYLLLRNFNETTAMLRQLVEGDSVAARERFYAAIAAQPLIETTNRKLRGNGDVAGWPGFGAVNAFVACAGEIVGVANLKSGIVIAKRIKILDGFFPNSVRIFANEVGSISPASERSDVLSLIPQAKVNISELIQSGYGERELVSACEKRRPPSGKPSSERMLYNVCLPCPCGVYVFTEETTRSPDELILQTKREATCDRCGTWVGHTGSGIAFFGIDVDRHPVWYTAGGSAEIEQRIRV